MDVPVEGGVAKVADIGRCDWVAGDEKEFLRAYMAEFRTYIGMVLTVLPRPREPSDDVTDERSGKDDGREERRPGRAWPLGLRWRRHPGDQLRHAHSGPRSKYGDVGPDQLWDR